MRSSILALGVILGLGLAGAAQAQVPCNPVVPVDVATDSVTAGALAPGDCLLEQLPIDPEAMDVDATYVDEHLGELVKDEDLSRYIL